MANCYDQLPAHYQPWVAFTMKAGLILLFTLINICGVRTAGFVQVLTSILKLLPLLAICLFGFSYVNPHHYSVLNTTGQSNFSALSAAAAITLWAYVGFESAIIPTDDATDTRTVKRATYTGFVICALLYIVSSVLVMGIIPLKTLALSEAPLADAGKIIFGYWGGLMISLGAIISVLGALNGSILVQVHVAMAAARDGLFIRSFADTNRFNSPAKGFIISGLVMTAILLFTLDKQLVDEFTFIVLLSTFAFLIPYFVSTAAGLILLFRERDKFNKKQFVRSLIICLLAIVYTFYLMVGAGKDVVFYGTFLFFSAFPLFAYFHIRRKKINSMA